MDGEGLKMAPPKVPMAPGWVVHRHALWGTLEGARAHQQDGMQVGMGLSSGDGVPGPWTYLCSPWRYRSSLWKDR